MYTVCIGVTMLLVSVCAHGQTIFAPQESKTPACELRGDWYIAISSREGARKFTLFNM